MFENEQEFQKLVRGLKIDAEPNPAHRERLRRQMLQTFAQTGQRSGRDGKTSEVLRPPSSVFRPRSSVLRLPFVRLAVAAVVLVAASIVLWTQFGRGPMTFATVRAASERMPWLYAVISRYQGDEVRTERHWYNFGAGKAYAMMEDGTVLGWDYTAGQKKLLYNPRVKALLISGLSGSGLGSDATDNLITVFSVFAARDDVSQSTTQYDGRTVRAFGIEEAESGVTRGGQPARLLKMTILADRQTRRVVAASAEHQDADGVVLAREEWVMSYPSSGPASVFDLGVPASATVIDGTRQHIGTPGNEPTPTPTPAAAGSFRLVPVEIKLPKARFIGTPQDGRVPNLERPRKGPRPPFLAPQGTTNVALGKPVTSSDPEPVIGSLDQITDGDKETADGSFVELGPGPQYVTIDLQERCEIYGVLVWHHHRWPRVYFDVVVQVADDPGFRTGVRTIFNNDTENALGLGAGPDMNYTETNEGKLLDGKGVRARYVRLYSNGNSNNELNHYIEVAVYGRPVSTAAGN
jgi:hypothetical protein